jgi:hypothetical protein
MLYELHLFEICFRKVSLRLLLSGCTKFLPLSASAIGYWRFASHPETQKPCLRYHDSVINAESADINGSRCQFGFISKGV